MKTNLTRAVLFLFMTLLFFGCGKTTNEKDLVGAWQIVDIQGENMNYGGFQTNVWTFHSNHTSTIPVHDYSEVEKGVWDIITENDTQYLKIQSVNSLFDTKFQMVMWKERDDHGGGYFLWMKLIKENVIFYMVRSTF